MSRWTHIIGSFYIETNVETDNLKSTNNGTTQER